MKIFLIFFFSSIIVNSDQARRFIKPRGRGRYKTTEAKRVEITSPPYVYHNYFEIALQSGFFVDKTMLIKDLINLPPQQSFTSLICPPFFGKSTNLDMVKRFLRISVDPKTGTQISNEENKDYKLFAQSNLKITNDSSFVKEHFGKYPVLFWSFKDVQGDTSRNVVRGMCQRIRGAVRSFGWLYKKVREQYKNDANETNNMKILTDMLTKDVDEWDTTSGLITFMGYLENHYKKKIILLIDDFDTPIIYCLSNHIFIEEIQNFYQNLLSLLGKELTMVSHAIVAGVTHLSKVCNSPKTEGLDFWYFLNNHLFIEYFGFTEEDVVQLIRNNSNYDLTKLKYLYDGYRVINSATSLYTTGEVIHHLRHGNMSDTSIKQDVLHSVMSCLQHETFFAEVMKFISVNPIQFELKTCATPDDTELIIQRLRHNCQGYSKHENDLFFTHMFENGYLSYGLNEDTFVTPNAKTRDRLKKEVLQYYKKHYNILLENPNVGNAIHEILHNVHTTSAMLNELTSTVNQGIVDKIKILSDFHLGAITYSMIFCNIHVQREPIQIRKLKKQEPLETGITYIVLSSDDEKTVLIAEVGVRKKMNKIMDSVHKLVPMQSKNESKIELIKYLPIVINGIGEVEMALIPNRDSW